MTVKVLTGTGLVAAILLGLASPAWAHVTIDPDSAANGAEITVRFRVPNEVSDANVVKVDIAFPTDHPLLGVAVEPIAGWTSTVTEVKLDPPVQTDDGPVGQAVREIAWNAAGGGTAPGQFQEFPVLVQRLPADADQAVFKAIQTYSNGTVVRWIDPVGAGQAAPDHPTPILKLTAARQNGPTAPSSTSAPASASGSGPGAGTGSASGSSSSAPVPVDPSKIALKSSVSSATRLGLLGIVLGALGLVVALVVALVAVTRGRGSVGDGPEPG